MSESIEEKKRTVLNRLARASGHLEAVKRMIEDGRDCQDVLIQLTAVRSAINKTEKIILRDYIDDCIDEALESGNRESLILMNDAIDRFVK